MTAQKTVFSRTHMNAAECLFITVTDTDGKMTASGYFTALDGKERRFEDGIVLSNGTAAKIRALEAWKLKNKRRCLLGKPHADDKTVLKLTVTDEDGKEYEKECSYSLIDEIVFIFTDEFHHIELGREPIDPETEFQKHKYNICGPVCGDFASYADKFSPDLGMKSQKNSEPKLCDGQWQCFFCRTVNQSKYCTECGSPKDASVFNMEKNNE